MIADYDQLFSLAIAFSGAYLALPEFRYRTSIKKLAKKKLRQIQTTVSDEVKDGVGYKCTCYLSEHREFPGEEPTELQMSQGWLKSYLKSYRNAHDRRLISITGLIAFAMIIISTLVKMFCDKASPADFSAYLVSLGLNVNLAGKATLFLQLGLLVLALFTIIMPVVLIVRGRHCVKSVRAYIMEQLKPSLTRAESESLKKIELEKMTVTVRDHLAALGNEDAKVFLELMAPDASG